MSNAILKPVPESYVSSATLSEIKKERLKELDSLRGCKVAKQSSFRSEREMCSGSSQMKKQNKERVASELANIVKRKSVVSRIRSSLNAGTGKGVVNNMNEFYKKQRAKSYIEKKKKIETATYLHTIKYKSSRKIPVNSLGGAVGKDKKELVSMEKRNAMITAATNFFVNAYYMVFIFATHPLHGLMLFRCYNKKKSGYSYQIPGGHIDATEFVSAAKNCDGNPMEQLKSAAKMGAAREFFEGTGIDIRGHLDRLRDASLRFGFECNRELPCELQKRLFFHLTLSDTDFITSKHNGEGSNLRHTLISPTNQDAKHLSLNLSRKYCGFSFESNKEKAASLLSKYCGGSCSKGLLMSMNHEITPLPGRKTIQRIISTIETNHEKSRSRRKADKVHASDLKGSANKNRRSMLKKLYTGLRDNIEVEKASLVGKISSYNEDASTGTKLTVSTKSTSSETIVSDSISRHVGNGFDLSDEVLDSGIYLEERTSNIAVEDCLIYREVNKYYCGTTDDNNSIMSPLSSLSCSVGTGYSVNTEITMDTIRNEMERIQDTDEDSCPRQDHSDEVSSTNSDHPLRHVHYSDGTDCSILSSAHSIVSSLPVDQDCHCKTELIQGCDVENVDIVAPDLDNKYTDCMVDYCVEVGMNNHKFDNIGTSVDENRDFDSDNTVTISKQNILLDEVDSVCKNIIPENIVTRKDSIDGSFEPVLAEDGNSCIVDNVDVTQCYHLKQTEECVGDNTTINVNHFSSPEKRLPDESQDPYSDAEEAPITHDRKLTEIFSCFFPWDANR